MISIEEMLHQAIQMNASDIFLVAGHPYAFKVNGTIISVGEDKLKPETTASLIKEIYGYVVQNRYEDFIQKKDDDFSFSIPDVGRFRCNVYMQRNSQAAVLRVVTFDLPDPVKLGVPEIITNLSSVKKGLILVSGPAGSGKSTTLACIIDKINQNRNVHIITIEDPIEFLHSHKQSIVSQREVYHDTQDYLNALRSALREAPEVILVGEMRDLETINVSVTAAETGHLILSTLHTVGAANTVDRMIDVFPPSQQQQIRVQLSMTLHAVVSEQLVPTIDGGIVPVFEIMIATPAIRTQIREGKIHQIDNSIVAGKEQGMQSMDESLFDLYQKGIISKDTAVLYANNAERMSKKIS
ncbi:type IV pilus twitching motility protein PilT [Amedibacillus sp. YH-ame6]